MFAAFVVLIASQWVMYEDALRALAFNEWDDRQAHRWWREFRDAEEASVAASETPTLTVDLAPRRAQP